MQPDLSLLPYDEAAPRDADGVPIEVDAARLPLALRCSYLHGRDCALDHAVPYIAQGSFGKSPDFLEASIQRWLHASLEENDNLPPEEKQAWRLGARVAIGPVKWALLTAMGEMRRATDAATLVAAALTVVGEAASLSDKLPKPQALPGLGAPLTRRPLRPEDFGAMPNPPRH